MKAVVSLAAILAVSISCAPHRVADTAPAAPPRPTAFERQVRNAVDAGDGDYSLRSHSERVAAHPDDLQLRLDLAKLYRDRGAPELALEHYRLAAARFPDSAEACLRLALSLRELKQQKEAAAALDGFLATHPQKSARFPAWLGILRDELKQWPEAEAAHRAALALDPAADYLHNNLGYSLLMQGKAEEAAAEFRAALRLNPHSALARNNLALSLASHPEEAVSNWRAVTDPASAHNNMAAVLIEEGKYAEARKELNVALGYNKAHTAALENPRLVSRLDGKPAFIPVKPVETRWEKWKSAIRKAITGSEPARPPGAASVPAAE